MEEESTPKPTLAQLKEQPHYSYSALNTYINTCQLLYYYRYIEKAEAERTPVVLPFGSAFHSVLSELAAASPTYQANPSNPSNQFTGCRGLCVHRTALAYLDSD